MSNATETLLARAEREALYALDRCNQLISRFISHLIGPLLTSELEAAIALRIRCEAALNYARGVARSTPPEREWLDSLHDAITVEAATSDADVNPMQAIATAPSVRREALTLALAKLMLGCATQLLSDKTCAKCDGKWRREEHCSVKHLGAEERAECRGVHGHEFAAAQHVERIVDDEEFRQGRASQEVTSEATWPWECHTRAAEPDHLDVGPPTTAETEADPCVICDGFWLKSQHCSLIHASESEHDSCLDVHGHKYQTAGIRRLLSMPERDSADAEIRAANLSYRLTATAQEVNRLRAYTGPDCPKCGEPLRATHDFIQVTHNPDARRDYWNSRRLNCELPASVVPWSATETKPGAPEDAPGEKGSGV